MLQMPETSRSRCCDKFLLLIYCFTFHYESDSVNHCFAVCMALHMPFVKHCVDK